MLIDQFFSLWLRQKTRCCKDHAVTHNDSAVMQRGFGVKDIAEQFGTGQGVEDGAICEVFAELRSAFDDDEGACAGTGEFSSRIADDGDGTLPFFLRIVILREGIEAGESVCGLTELFEGTAEFGLKEDDESEHTDTEQFAKDEGNGAETDEIADEERDDQQEDTFEELTCAGLTNHFEKSVDEVCEEENVYNVNKTDRLEHI